MKSSRLEDDVMIALLEERGLMMVDGHFDYGNGYHGRSYLTAQPLLADPAEVMKYAHDLMDKIPFPIRDQVDLVAGPVTGGALFGFCMAVAIDSSRAHGPHHKVLYAPIYKNKGTLALRDYYRTLIAGEFMKASKRVLIVDDVSNTGMTLKGSSELIVGCGGQVVGTAVLYDRKSAIVHLPNHFSLSTCEIDPGLVLADQCEQCRLKIQITRF